MPPALGDTGEHRARGIRLDNQTTLSLALVLALVGGGVQYGRQSQRIESMEREIAAMGARIELLTEAVTSLLLTVRQQTSAIVPRPQEDH